MRFIVPSILILLPITPIEAQPSRIFANSPTLISEAGAVDAPQIMVIAPARVPETGYVPIVTRVLDNTSGDVDRLATFTFDLAAGAADTTFRVKKGVGTVVLRAGSGENLNLVLDGGEYGNTQKTVAVSTQNQAGHAGQLTGGPVSWQAGDDHVITADVTVPAATTLEIEPGAYIQLDHFVNMIFEGDVTIAGTQDAPIVFASHGDDPWGGLEFLGGDVSLKWCFFVNAGGDSVSKGWLHTGRQPILFAKQNAHLQLDNCFILDSPGKAIGALSSRVTASHCVTSFVFHGGEFEQSMLEYSDSYVINIPNDDGIFHDWDNDGFHINGLYSGSDAYSVIRNSVFISGKDDAIDHYGSRVLVQDCWLEGWTHEGVAASNRDTIRVRNTVIRGCQQGVEVGWAAPQVFVDHCVVVDNEVGLRIGDDYDRPPSSYAGGVMYVTNTIAYGNDDNVKNNVMSSGTPVPGAFEISYSMLNDTDNEGCEGCITGEPLFDPIYQLLPGSPGLQAGNDGSDMGLLPAASDTVSVGVEGDTADLPEGFYLSQNYPNPFNAGTQVRFGLPQEALVDLTIYNIAGQKILDILAGVRLPAGVHNQRIASGFLPTGIYLYTLKAVLVTGRTFSTSHKMVYLK